jgi:acetoin utilization protein AcuB
MKRPTRIMAYMTPFPHSIDAAAPLADAREFMRKRRIRHLPVTEQGRLFGLVTDRDIKLLLGPDFAYPPESSMTVRDACVADPYVVDVATPLAEVARTMARRHLGSALVTRAGKLVGVFTTTDACRVLASLFDKPAPEPPRVARRKRVPPLRRRLASGG